MSIAISRKHLGPISIGLLLIATATAPFFIRFSNQAGVPSLSLVAIRLIAGTLIITPYAWRKHSHTLTHMERRDWMLAVLAGTFHALGLVFLFYGLEYTSILVNGVLRRTSPLWSIVMEIFLLGAVFKRNMWWGLGITMFGSVLVVFGSGGAIEPGPNPLLGAILSLGNAFTLSCYLIIGRSLRHKLPFMAYSWVLFCSGGVVSLIVAIATGSPLWGFSAEAVFWLILVVLIAQVVGHLSANYAVRSMTATHLAILMQAGVILSAILAFFVFGELPSLLQLAGSAVLLFGLYWVSSG